MIVRANRENSGITARNYDTKETFEVKSMVRLVVLKGSNIVIWMEKGSEETTRKEYQRYTKRFSQSWFIFLDMLD